MILLGKTRITAENGTYGGYQYSVMHDGVTALVEGCPREHSSKNVHERVAYSAMKALLQNKREQDHDRAKEIMAGIEAEKELDVAEEVAEDGLEHSEEEGVAPKAFMDIVGATICESAPTMKNKKREIHAYMKARGIKYGANDNKGHLLQLIEEFHANEERKE